MSIKIGINGTTSFNNVIDVIFGTSDKTKQDINFVNDWNGTIIWQRDTRIELNENNTRFSYTNSWSETSSAGHYEPEPHPYKKDSSTTDYRIEYSSDGTNWIPLTEGTHYTVSWSNNRVPASGEISSGTKTGTGTMNINGTGSYKGTISKTFNISYTYKAPTIDISGKCTINLAAGNKLLDDESQTYTASVPDLTISVETVYYDTSTLLIPYVDYTVEYSYPGDKTYTHDSEGDLEKEVTVTITGQGSYSGVQSKTYDVIHEYAISNHLTFAYSNSSSENEIYEFSSPLGAFVSRQNGITQTRCSCYANGYNYIFSGVSAGTHLRTKNGRRLRSVESNISKIGGGIVSCCHTGHRFVALVRSKSVDGVVLAYSSNATSWTSSTISGLPSEVSVSANLSNVIYADGKVYATAYSTDVSYGVLLVSEDHGTTFTAYKPSGFSGGRLCYGNGSFVSVFGDYIYYSTSPTTEWNVPSSRKWVYSGDVCYGNGVFCVIGKQDNSPYVRTSTNGKTWTEGESAPNGKDVCFANGNFYMITAPDKSKFSILKSAYGTSFFSYGQDDIPTNCILNPIDRLSF